MARWDEILTLPIQNPPTLEFSAADLVWSKVEGWRDKIDKVALIPFTRVDDFVRGEQSNKECPTRFHVEARRRRSQDSDYKPKVDGILEYILYWCSFGPDDHRKGGVIRPSRVYNAKRKTPAGRPNTKRGCVCHFIVKQLIAQPSVALIIYNEDKHVDKQGKPCHGPMDEKAVGTRAMYAPYISDELRLHIQSLLYVGVPVETIMQRHAESVEKRGGPANRDDLLTHRYVRIQERRIRRSSYELDSDDAVSLSRWVEEHRSYIFYYEEFSDTDPFVVGIQTEWQLQQMIRYGNRSIVASDSSFGINKLKYPVHSLVVFNSNNKAVPVAWIITPQVARWEIRKWIRALYERVHSKDPNWKLAGFIVDDPSTDVLTIKEVFHCSVLISFWRVRHAWHKNLVQRCSDTEMRVGISRQLGQIINIICTESGDADLFEDFIENFVDCSEFMDYFRATWFPRMGTWSRALRCLPLASQETSAAMEFYHHQLSLRLLNEKDMGVYQRTDWLVDKLGTKVHSYYWLDEYSRKNDFARYQKDEWRSGLTFWQRASDIPNSCIVLEEKCAKITNQKNPEKIHIVRNPGSDFALCDCDWSRMGNLCEHVFKVCQLYRDRGLASPSISLFKYTQMLTSMLHTTIHDSVLRDHAVSLAVCAHMQLKAILKSGSGCAGEASSASTPMEQTPAEGRTNANDIFNSEAEHPTNKKHSGDKNGSSVVNDCIDRDAVETSLVSTLQTGAKDATNEKHCEDTTHVTNGCVDGRVRLACSAEEVPNGTDMEVHFARFADSQQKFLPTGNETHRAADEDLHTICEVKKSDAVEPLAENGTSVTVRGGKSQSISVVFSKCMSESSSLGKRQMPNLRNCGHSCAAARTSPADTMDLDLEFRESSSESVGKKQTEINRENSIIDMVDMASGLELEACSKNENCVSSECREEKVGGMINGDVVKDECCPVRAPVIKCYKKRRRGSTGLEEGK